MKWVRRRNRALPNARYPGDPYHRVARDARAAAGCQGCHRALGWCHVELGCGNAERESRRPGAGADAATGSVPWHRPRTDSDGKTVRDGDADTGSDSVADPPPDTNTDSDAFAHSNPNLNAGAKSHANTHPGTDAHTNSHPGTDANTHPGTDSNRNWSRRHARRQSKCSRLCDKRGLCAEPRQRCQL